MNTRITLTLSSVLASVLSTLIGLGIAASLAGAQVQPAPAPSCAYLHVPHPDSAYAFTQAGLYGLSYALTAWRETVAVGEEQEKTGRAPQTFLIATMRHTKLASESYSCAEAVLQPYALSPDKKMIAPSAEFLVAIYRQHRRLNDQFIDILRNLPDLYQQQVKLADTISTIQVERDKLWTDLRKTTTLAVLALVNQDKAERDGRLQTLLITRRERSELVRQLLRLFPDVKAQANKPDAPEPLFDASLYHLFLTKPYKCSDD